MTQKNNSTNIHIALDTFECYDDNTLDDNKYDNKDDENINNPNNDDDIYDDYNPAKYIDYKLFLEDQEEAKLEHANRFIMGGKRLNGRRQLRQLLERKIQKVIGKQGFMTIDIITKWQQIVGKELYAVAKPVKIKFVRNDRANGILVIKTLSSAHALTISYQEDVIIERVNTFFGYKALNKIQIIHGSLNLNQFQDQANKKDNKAEKYAFHMQKVKKSKKYNAIQDDGIKNALMDLYATIKSKK